MNTRTTVYDGLVARLRAGIRGGSLRAGAFVATEQELSRQTGISRVSVRRATDQLIREGLVERRPGKGLFVREPDRRTRIIQVVVPDLGFEQCVLVARGAQLLGAERGFQVQVYDAHNQMERDLAVLKRLPDQAAEGAIILSWHHPRFTELIFDLKRLSYPFVLVDEHAQNLEVPSVTADNRAGGMQVGRALVGLGHTRVGFVGNLRADTVRERLEGLRDAIGDAGLPFDRTLTMDLAVEPQQNWTDRIDRCTRELMSRPDRPTAIFYSDDQVAADGYRTLLAMGLQIPQDVSIVGFDDNPLCRWLNPQLASVRQPSTEMGKSAMEILLTLMSPAPGQKQRAPQRLTLPVEWVPRASIGPAITETRS